MDVSAEAKTLDEKAHQNCWTNSVQVVDAVGAKSGARHPDRPHCKDYIEALFTGIHAAGGRPETLP